MSYAIKTGIYGAPLRDYAIPQGNVKNGYLLSEEKPWPSRSGHYASKEEAQTIADTLRSKSKAMRHNKRFVVVSI